MTRALRGRIQARELLRGCRRCGMGARCGQRPGALPKSVQAGARRALNEIIGAEDRAHAERAITAPVGDYGASGPRLSPRWSTTPVQQHHPLSKGRCLT
jgi:hypothetical protein